MNERKTVEVPEKWFQAFEFFPEGKFTMQELKDFVEIMSTKEQADSEEYLYELQFYGHDGGFEIVRHQVRPETDQEYADRIKKEQAVASKTKEGEAKEYDQYLKLKAKFEYKE